MNVQNPVEGEQQLKVPERPKQPVPEVKAKEKPLGQIEQGMVSFINKDGGIHKDGNPQTGNPDAILQGLANADTKSAEAPKTVNPQPQGAQEQPQKTPYEQFMEDSDDKTKIFGGEIISPTTVRVPNQEKGETSDQVRKEAEIGGWLSAITNTKDRPNDVQEIVNAAKTAGVPKETLKTHLESLGINVTQFSEAANLPSDQTQHREIDLDNLTPKDYVDLFTRYNRVREKLVKDKDIAHFRALGSLPVGAVMNAAWTKGDEKSRAAYAQISQALDGLDTLGTPNNIQKVELTTPPSSTSNKDLENSLSLGAASHLESQQTTLPVAEQSFQSEEIVDPELILPSGKRATWIRYGGKHYGPKLDKEGNFHLGPEEDITTVLTRPRSQWSESSGIDTDEIHSWGINIPPEIDQAARLAVQNEEVDENGIPINYQDYVGKRLGWIEDPLGSGQWVIPAIQIEQISDKQAAQMARAKK